MRQTENRRSRTLLAVYVLFGIGALGLVAAVAALLWLASSEDGGKLIDLASTSYEIALHEQAGPASDALRDLGCANAIVTSTSAFGDSLPGLFGMEDPPDFPLVVCVMPFFEDSEIECDAVAERFLSATHDDPELFFVSVTSAENGGITCQSLYDDGGNALDGMAAGGRAALRGDEDPAAVFGDPSGVAVGRPSPPPEEE